MIQYTREVCHLAPEASPFLQGVWADRTAELASEHRRPGQGRRWNRIAMELGVSIQAARYRLVDKAG